jgi:hypothetical protein
MEVYGHLVAVDCLGEAYVIPFSSTLKNIRARFAATTVTIATLPDIVQSLLSFEAKADRVEDHADKSRVQCLSNEEDIESDGCNGIMQTSATAHTLKSPLFSVDSGYASRATTQPSSRVPSSTSSSIGRPDSASPRKVYGPIIICGSAQECSEPPGRTSKIELTGKWK